MVIAEFRNFETKIKEMKTKTLIVVTLIGLLVGFAFGQWAVNIIPRETSNNTSVQSENGKVSVMVDYGNGKINVYTGNIEKEDETLFELTQNIAEKNEVGFEYTEFPDLGVLIEKIGTEKNGTDQKYWQYWANNEYAKVGADMYKVKSGDIIEWKFVNQQGF
ncbi:MAG: hypothetical protein A3F24_01665 [Candidatus Colwellbacteria bacterium RIFCSPHIGHO2_12_FULL_44_17]|uniref:Transcobalamin-like C-terminal domain-containing protein n=1 Tax=Candidatus Colwellbacteria bacterium RIFCSPHIGHO2_12_FULL_44_17 TaxID=1797689 RepID=A0A1G1Z3J6_9BACT|nr:MAG: hypothetical protein A3F24_01665 [Candidatus Colwellbacteria bacterium RIFCSPHIGHO2_12_FULL_44_17]